MIAERHSNNEVGNPIPTIGILELLLRHKLYVEQHAGSQRKFLSLHPGQD
jgi:hypothetical protein